MSITFELIYQKLNYYLLMKNNIVGININKQFLFGGL